MAAGRFETDPAAEPPVPAVARPRPAEKAAPDSWAPLELVARSTRLLLVLAVAGAALAAGVAALGPARYRAVARVLVVEPRLGSGPSVDFNLTPVRSYAALLTSPSLLAGCSGGGLADRLRVRMPENTRVLELILDDASPARAAELVNCAAERAIVENRRINADLAARSASVVDEALQKAQASIAGLEGELANARRDSRLDVDRGELKAALDDAAESADEERRARMRIADAAARRRSFSEAAAGRESSAVRELAERGGAEATADEAAGRASLEAASLGHTRAAARAAALESKTAAAESALAALTRRLDAASGARADLEKRRASAPLEAAAKAFELAVVSPAVPPARPTRVPAALAAAAGAVCALVVGVLFVLSRD
jgi:uncharacterized protein involved in exopolysaccharide biosynthesis